MRTAPESRKISNLVTAVGSESLIPRPNFQRRAVWTNRDKIAFIETIINGYPFPEIYVAAGSVDTQSGAATEVLVDGQQRVRTIVDYFRGVSPFSRSRGLTKYADLSQLAKLDFLNYDVAVRNLGILEESQVVEVFRRINATSYDLNEIERYNAVYLGEFKKHCEEMAQREYLSDIKLFSAADIRRMRDVAYLASLTATLMSDYFHRDDAIEQYLEEYNEDFPRRVELQERIDAACEFIRSLDLNTRLAFRKADFYNIIVEIDRVLHRNNANLSRLQTKDILEGFFEKIAASRDEPPTEESVRRYYEATLQNTNDRYQRIERGEVIRELLRPATTFPPVDVADSDEV